MWSAWLDADQPDKLATACNAIPHCVRLLLFEACAVRQEVPRLATFRACQYLISLHCPSLSIRSDIMAAALSRSIGWPFKCHATATGEPKL